MKRVIWSLSLGFMMFVGLFTGTLHAQSPGYTLSGVIPRLHRHIAWHDNLDSGWRESQRTGRPMVIFITAAKCRYCDAMKDITWQNRSIENRVASEFVAVQLTPERNARELSRIEVKMYPMTIVAKPEGKVVDHRKGFQPPELLHELLNRALVRR
ncbi:MAG: thioredoxin family protein [Planctomycetaceae bacterium]